MRARRRGELASSLPSSLSFRRPKGAELQEILESVLATLPPGALLPSERGLARRYGVARATVSQAVDALAAKGLVYRVHGSGTFMAEPKFLQPETLTSFTERRVPRALPRGAAASRRGPRARAADARGVNASAWAGVMTCAGSLSRVRLVIPAEQAKQGELMANADFPAPEKGFVLTHFIVAADVERSRDFYVGVLGGRVVLEGEPTIVKLANGWVTINVGGGPTDDKPEVVLEPPGDLNRVSAFLNIRVADIHAAYEEWRARGAEFLTPPKDHGAEIRCYMRDPDGHLIEVGQPTGVLDRL